MGAQMLICVHCGETLFDYVESLRAKLEAMEESREQWKADYNFSQAELRATDKALNKMQAKLETAEKRLDKSPYGDDKIDELEQAQEFTKFALKSAEKANVELQAQVAMLRGAITEIRKQVLSQQKSDTGLIYGICRKVIETIPTEAAERVNGLVDALEILEQMGTNESIAHQALAKYRGEMGE